MPKARVSRTLPTSAATENNVNTSQHSLRRWQCSLSPPPSRSLCHSPHVFVQHELGLPLLPHQG